MNATVEEIRIDTPWPEDYPTSDQRCANGHDVQYSETARLEYRKWGVEVDFIFPGYTCTKCGDLICTHATLNRLRYEVHKIGERIGKRLLVPRESYCLHQYPSGPFQFTPRNGFWVPGRRRSRD